MLHAPIYCIQTKQKMDDTTVVPDSSPSVAFSAEGSDDEDMEVYPYNAEVQKELELEERGLIEESCRQFPSEEALSSLEDLDEKSGKMGEELVGKNTENNSQSTSKSEEDTGRVKEESESKLELPPRSTPKQDDANTENHSIIANDSLVPNSVCNVVTTLC